MSDYKIGEKVIEDKHRLLLEALRNRESEILRFIAILGPALGGFIWLLRNAWPHHIPTFIIGTTGIILLLLMGAWYSAALGYNWRYILEQLRKFERKLKLERFILKAWCTNANEGKIDRKFWRLGDPPEIISVFWWSFIISIAFVGISSSILLYGHICQSCTPSNASVGITALLLSALTVLYPSFWLFLIPSVAPLGMIALIELDPSKWESFLEDVIFIRIIATATLLGILGGVYSRIFYGKKLYEIQKRERED